MEHMLQTLEQNIHFLYVEAQEAQMNSEAQLFLEPDVDPRGCSPERIKTPRGSNSAQSHPLQQLSLELEAIKVIEPLSTAADRIEAARLWHRADPWVRSLLDRARQQVTLSQLRQLVTRTTAEGGASPLVTAPPNGVSVHQRAHSIPPEGIPTGCSSLGAIYELGENIRNMKKQLQQGGTTSSRPSRESSGGREDPKVTSVLRAEAQEARRWASSFLQALQAKGIAGSEFIRMSDQEKTKVFEDTKTQKFHRGAIVHLIPTLL